MSQTKVLLIEDTHSLSMLYRQYLVDEDIALTSVETGREGFAVIDRDPPDLILLDIALPDVNGLEILRYVHDRENPIAVVVITANGSIKLAVEAMREGAYDFLVKPFNAERLKLAVRSATTKPAGDVAPLKASQSDVNGKGRFGFIGRSAAMEHVYRTIDSSSPSKATLFITGESGTGKELCAEAIHHCSPRRGHPFVAINCGAIPRELMESEIFGHRKGAFTGAYDDREGAAQLAHTGTLFLDEICEMDLDLQTKLLRFIQTGAYQRVGDANPRQVDVRFVCATNRDVLTEVRAGRFREDLYYRLHVIPLQMPPLRDRGDDILAIAEHLLKLYSREEGKAFSEFDWEAKNTLIAYPWPGNVRQLQNVVRNSVVLNEGTVVTHAMLPPPLNAFSLKFIPEVSHALHTHDLTRSGSRPSGRDEGSENAFLPSEKTEIRELWEMERDIIEHTIGLCDGNIPQAAGFLGIAPSTIYRKKASWEEMR